MPNSDKLVLMQTESTPTPAIASSRNAALWCGFGMLLIGFIGLLGWVLGSAVMKSIVPSYQPIVLSTSLLFIILGGVQSLAARQPLRKGALVVLLGFSAFIMIFAVLEAVTQATGVAVSIEDAILLRYAPLLHANPNAQISPVTVALVFLIGLAQSLFLSKRFTGKRERVLSSAVGLVGSIVFLSSMVFTLGYMYHTPLLYEEKMVPISALAALAALLSGAGLVALAGNEALPLSWFSGASTRARLLRAFLPSTVLVMLLLSLAQSFVVNVTPVNPAISAAVTVLLFELIIVVIILQVARAMGNFIDHKDRELREAYDERERLVSELKHLAHHDVLTGLPNRKLFRDFLIHDLSKAGRNHQKLALLFLDLDRFKDINDTLGHETGDELLKAVAGRLKSSVRESDIVARIGGDEFNILLPDIMQSDDITGLAQKVIDSLREPFLISGHELHVTTSIGVSVYPDDSNEVDALFRYADIALYNAKERGRNMFRFYDHDMNQRSIEKLRFENWLRHALAREELTVHYQPLVDIKTRRIKSAEALVRWKHPKLGMLEAKRFIPIAESIGYSASIDEWVLRTACSQFKAWIDAGFAPPCVTVNISSRMFLDPAFADAIMGTLHDAGLTTKCLDIDIKESLVMGDIERNIGLFKKLAAKSIGIAIENFGTGYSSLYRLKKYPITRLKIDKSIVQDATTDPDSRTLISAITAMAHKMHILVVAEGVETEEQLSFLKEAECDEAQGHLFSEPVSPERFSELMAASK